MNHTQHGWRSKVVDVLRGQTGQHIVWAANDTHSWHVWIIAENWSLSQIGRILYNLYKLLKQGEGMVQFETIPDAFS